MPADIPYGRQDISTADIDSVVGVLKSAFLTQGPGVPAFEACVAAYTSAAHAVAVNSATSALHVACLALGVGPGDRVWTTPITFVAAANCARYCGADVDFVDIDPRTSNMSVECLSARLSAAARAGRLPKVVIPVHMSGQSCDMAGIHALAQHYGFRIIEDASHALGGRYRGEPVGNCRFSDVVVFSFHSVKTVTTAEGGMALTNDAEVAKRMRLLRSHGITREPSDMTHTPDGPWYYQQITLGFNYRMTDVQAMLGVSQMRRVDAFVARRNEMAKKYDDLLAPLPVTPPWQHPDSYSGFHLYVVRLDLDHIRSTHREVFEAMRAEGIGVALHYIPVYRQPYYEQLGFRPGYCPEAERYYAQAITLPLYPGLLEEQQLRVVRSLADAVEG